MPNNLSPNHVLRKAVPKESKLKLKPIESKFGDDAYALYGKIKGEFSTEESVYDVDNFVEDVRYLIKDNIRWDVYNAICTGPMNELQDRLDNVLDGYFGKAPEEE